MENKSYRSQIEQQEVTLKSCTEEIRRLETANQEMKVRLTKAEAEAARNAVENQKLLQVRLPMHVTLTVILINPCKY